MIHMCIDCGRGIFNWGSSRSEVWDVLWVSVFVVFNPLDVSCPFANTLPNSAVLSTSEFLGR
jgi:hypothetical protein